MQSYLQYRRIYKQLEKQIVTKYEKPDDVWTSEGRYSYTGGEIESHPQEAASEEAGRRASEHGHRTTMTGPAFLPRHSARQHLERDGDVERADYDPEIQADPYTINTRETLGDRTNLMLTGVERPGGEYGEKRIVVTYEGDTDPMDPHNWAFWTRVRCTVVVSLMAFTILWSSTIDSTVNPSTKKEFGTSYALQSVPTAMFLVGLGIGGMITAPASEILGRNAIYIPSLVLFMLFDMGAGLSRNVAQRIAGRFFAGFFGSTPVVAAAGTLTDLWSRTERVYAFPIYSTIAFLGPLTGPTAGGFIVQSPSMSWRWVDWITIILAAIVLCLVILFLPETYSPLILRWKARQLRRLTGNSQYRAPLEIKKVSFLRRMGHGLTRPVLFFVTEPIIMVFTVYLSVILIVLYTWIAGYVFIYEMIYHFNPGQVGMALLAIAVGMLCAAPFVPLALRLLRKDIQRCRSRGESRPGPEVSLYMGMFGAPFIPIALFWIGWTARPSIRFWSPLAGSSVFGFGVICVFVSSIQYVADSFEFHAASALAAIHMFRFIAAGVMRVVAKPFYSTLGIGWTLTVLGLLATCLVPVPYVLYWYGPKVRSWSRYSATAG